MRVFEIKKESVKGRVVDSLIDRNSDLFNAIMFEEISISQQLNIHRMLCDIIGVNKNITGSELEKKALNFDFNNVIFF